MSALIDSVASRRFVMLRAAPGDRTAAERTEVVLTIFRTHDETHP